MNLKYLFGSIVSLPLLPLLYFQGKKIQKKVPILSEAKEPFGIENANYKKNFNIICIGESTIAGVGADFHKNAFTGSFARELSIQLSCSINWKVYAKSGFTVKRISQKIIPRIKEETTDLLVVGIGGNEAFTLNSPKKFKREVIILIEKLQLNLSNTPIVFTNMPPIKEFPAFTKPVKFIIGNLVEILGETLQTIIEKYPNVYFNNEVITLSKWKERNSLKGNISNFFSDGVHPSQLTYQVWGKEMANYIVANQIMK